MATLQSYFQAAARRFPDSTAVHCSGASCSYRELSLACQRIWYELDRQGYSATQSTIGVICRTGYFPYAAMLAVMNSGNIYVPLNPEYPVDRLEAITRAAGIRVVVSDAESTSRVQALNKALAPNTIVEMRAESILSATDVAHADLDTWSNKERSYPSPEDYAYLLFTSGSTGTPKGIGIKHRNVVPCIEAAAALANPQPTDRVAQFADLSFDVSIAEIFLCWMAGGALYVPNKSDRLNAVRFAAKNRLTVWSSVPTLVANQAVLGMLKQNSLPTLRLSLFCGEALPYSLMIQWHGAAPNSVIANLYGPTEASIFTSVHVDHGRNMVGEGLVPIGVPFPTFAHRVVPLAGAEAGPGTGELWISGPQVCNGYWSNPAADAAAFVVTRDVGVSTKWYRTGDLVETAPDGDLRFLGRVDHQIKVRGNRVELLEVELVIRRLTGADMVAVVPIHAADGRCEEFAAFCSCEISEKQLRQDCHRLLPEYMVPERIYFLQNFPKTAAGKIDHKALVRMLEERSRQEHASFSDGQSYASR